MGKNLKVQKLEINWVFLCVGGGGEVIADLRSPQEPRGEGAPHGHPQEVKYRHHPDTPTQSRATQCSAPSPSAASDSEPHSSPEPGPRLWVSHLKSKSGMAAQWERPRPPPGGAGNQAGSEQPPAASRTSRTAPARKPTPRLGAFTLLLFRAQTSWVSPSPQTGDPLERDTHKHVYNHHTCAQSWTHVYSHHTCIITCVHRHGHVCTVTTHVCTVTSTCVCDHLHTCAITSIHVFSHLHICM